MQRLIDIIRKTAAPEVSAEDIADILWLAIHQTSHRDNEDYQENIEHQPEPKQEPSPQNKSTNQEPTTPHEPASLYADQSTLGENQPHQAIGGIPFKTPSAPALPHKLNLGRNLYPLKQRVKSRTLQVFDEGTTVRLSADGGIWLPMVRAAAERWFDVAIVIDTTATMAVWYETVKELFHMLTHHGAFRDVRIWHMATDTTPVQLFGGLPTSKTSPRAIPARTLITPGNNRLILVVSDVVSRGWHTGDVQRFLAPWGDYHPVTIVHMLPPHLWSRTALGLSPQVSFSASSPGTPNTHLSFDPPRLRLQHVKHLLDKATNPHRLCMPVITLEPEGVKTWAQMITGKHEVRVPGVVFDVSKKSQTRPQERCDSPSETPLSNEERVHLFLATASPTAQRLAGYLSLTTPLTMEVIRLIQRAMLPDSHQVHLAEVFLSGMLKQVSIEPVSTGPYAFRDGVCAYLRSMVPIPKSLEVLRLVGEYIGKHTGHPFDFHAWLEDPTKERFPGGDDWQPFATLTSDVLAGMGGQFAEWARDLQPSIQEEKTSTITPNVVSTDTILKNIPDTEIQQEDEQKETPKKRRSLLDRFSNWLGLGQDSQYLKSYLSHIYYQHRYFDVKGLSTKGPHALNLDRVFVELSVAPRSFHEASANPIETVPTALQTGTHTIWQFMNNPHMKGLPLAIIGAPGSGKTTLMRNIALVLATRSQQNQRKDIPNLLPILLFIRILAPSVAHVQHNHSYAAYESGLEMLKNRLGRNHPRISEFHIYEQRLRENILHTQRYGSTETLKSERNEIVTHLNELAMETINTPFNDLMAQQNHTSNDNPRLDILTLAQAIADQLEREQGPQPPNGWFEQQLAQGRCLVMFDGLDEVAGPDLRGEVVAWVERQMRVYANNLFLITSRPYGYKSNPLSGVTVLEVQPFTHEQAKRFIHNWYLANEIVSTQNDDAGVQQQARQQADDVLQQINKNPSLSALAVNPLLLTMNTTVHRYRSSLPGRRVELYAEICEVFLGKRKQALGIELDMTPAQKQSVLQSLAYHMMCQESREITIDAAVKVIQEPLKLVGSSSTGVDFLKRIEEQSGLLLEKELGVYSFAHKTFQEYLAAAHIHENKIGTTLVQYIGTEWWNETIRLYVAQADASEIVAACLAYENPSVDILTLAVDCREEAKNLSEDLRARVDELLTKDLEHPDPARRRLATEVHLSRRLRNLHRLDEQREIDLDYITCAEYQLFLDDMQAQDEYYQPDHWTSYHFPEGSANEPVTGIRAEYAKAFCNWLTHWYGNGATIRLPTQEEWDESPSLSLTVSSPQGGIRIVRERR